ncbi:hypothetical protein [Chitinilyticum piscinae]|uniref:Uncharacterized protein n=1 Tax=Chitinilyticum piscinae TaxID=2866724 RepID=A0A8J7G0Q1_9NEIS|nr:hypothetical protein [Chitinilyticum piscinae]MBE9609218.1 hypothetical protein [Chitinilyticum piscinae]
MQHPIQIWRWVFWLAACLTAAFVYKNSIDTLGPPQKNTAADRLRVILPESAQIFLAGGDSHLAANLGVFRAVTLTTGSVDSDTIQTLARIQVSAARLNPYSGDNYYIAQAVLPWQGEVTAANELLGVSAKARRWDYMPGFFLAFNQQYFLRQPRLAIATLNNYAIPRAPTQNHAAFQAMISKWLEQGETPEAAKALLMQMYKSTSHPQLKKILFARITRLDGLITIQNACTTYRVRYGAAPKDLSDLLESGVLQEIPNDPFKIGYQINAEGQAEFIYRRN